MKELTGTTIRTASGNYLDFLDPDPSIVKIEDIASGLSRICRFGGQLPNFKWYSVAEHSCHCVWQAMNDCFYEQDLLLALLLHDAPEAYCGDVVKPLKNVLTDCYTDIENRIEAIIEEALDVDISGNYNFVKSYDIEMLYAEKQALFNVNVRPREVRAIQPKFRYWDYETAYKEFLTLYKRIVRNELPRSIIKIGH
jgi:hypothetical protein